LTTPEHTRRAREILGPGVLLAPEQKVVLDPDRSRARALGHQMVPRYLGMMNYASNLRRLGYTQTDLTASGSDRLVDDLFAHGDTGAVAAAVTRHLEAGADHVAIQLLGTDDPLPGLAALAERLLG
jgi:probable F420-dependent oxidoreductase